MVGYPSQGIESQNYFPTKQSKAKAVAGHPKASPKAASKAQHQPKPFSQHNGQNLKPKSPSGQKQSHKHPLERTNSSPKPIPQKHARHSPNPHRATPPHSNRSTPPRSTISPSRSSPNNFASSTCYQPPTPSSLPKPPTHWTSIGEDINLPVTISADPTAHLKLLLNVQA